MQGLARRAALRDQTARTRQSESQGLRERGFEGWKLAIGAVRGVLVWAPPDEPRRMPEAPAVQSAEVDLTDEGGREGNPRIKALVLPALQARHQAAAEA